MDLILSKISGAFTEKEHHKIAATLSAETDENEALGNPTYNYSVGLIMGKEIVISAPPENIVNLCQKVTKVVKE